MNKGLQIRGLSLLALATGNELGLLSNESLPGCEKNKAYSGEEDLLKALLHASPHEYSEAVKLRQYKDELLLEAEKLQSEIGSQIATKSKTLAPSMYGWIDPDLKTWSEIQEQIRMGNETKLNIFKPSLEILKRIENQIYKLEDKSVADELFTEMRNMLLHDGAVTEVNYAPKLFKHALLEGKKRSVRVASKLPLTCVAKNRFQASINKKEMELQVELSRKFRANPIPASSIIPKYTMIMSNLGNRSLDIRNREIIRRMNEHQTPEKIMPIPEKKFAGVPRIEKTVIEDSKAKRSKLFENEKTAGLTSDHTFKPAITKQMPNFQEEIERFHDSLEKRRNDDTRFIEILPFSGLEKHQKLSDSRKRLSNEKVLKDEYTAPIKSLGINLAAIKAKPFFKTTLGWEIK